jgi:hypothetical protein
MKKISTLVLTLFLGATLALAQNTDGDKSSLNPQPLPPGKSKATVTTKAKKGHKGGKKGKQGSATSNATTTKGSGGTTPPPK